MKPTANIVDCLQYLIDQVHNGEVEITQVNVDRDHHPTHSEDGFLKSSPTGKQTWIIDVHELRKEPAESAKSLANSLNNILLLIGREDVPRARIFDAVYGLYERLKEEDEL